MPYLERFDNLCETVVRYITEANTTQNYIDALRYHIYNNPATTYFGVILQNMHIVVINDLNPKAVDYNDPSPEAYRHPIWKKVYCGGGYNPKNWMTMPTMAVDPAGNLYIGEQFLEEISKEFPESADFTDVVKTILLHESMHISELTFFRGIGKEGNVWNIATDTYINYYLILNGRKLPEKCCKPDKDGNLSIDIERIPGKKEVYKYNIQGKSAENMYDELMSLFKNQKPPTKPTGPPPPLQNGDPVLHTESNEYGVVLDPSTDPVKIRRISKEEAMLRDKIKKTGIANI